MRIGIVEDSPALAAMFKNGLELSGEQVTLYECAQEAMSAILRARFDNVPLPVEILIIDVDQGIDNTAIMNRLRLFFTPAELYIIIISGQSIIERNLLSRNLFDIRTLSKPITPEQLLKEVRKEQEAAKG